MKILRKHIKLNLSSPWVVALIPFLLTLFFVTGYFKKYNLELISHNSISKLFYYVDLDNDGNSEHLDFYTYQNAQIRIFNLGHKFEEIYNLPGCWANNRREDPVFYIGDADKDGFKEIYAFTINSYDSLFVSIIQHYPDNKFVKNRFITKLHKTENAFDYTIIPMGLEDNNGDGLPEFLFAINAGYPLQPRAVFAWDLKIDSLYRSPLMGSAIKPSQEQIYFKDINEDGIKEIFLQTVGIDNYKDSIPYTDKYSWIMVFTKNLEFLFEPIKITGPQTGLSHFPYEMGDSTNIGVFIYYFRSQNPYPTFQVYNRNGKKVDNIETLGIKEKYGKRFFKRGEKLFTICSDKGFVEIDLFSNNLTKIVKSIKIPANHFIGFYDVDLDGEEEILVTSELNSNLFVVRSDLSTVNETNIEISNRNQVINTSVAVNNSKPEYIVLSFKGVANYLKYCRNPRYYLNFVFAVLYYFLLVIAFAQLKKVWLSSLVRKQQTEQRMQKLQMQTVMNQLNPHFTYNAINTVGAAILNNEPKKAYNNLTMVSNLLRKSVDHAFKPFKTLGEEIDFVKEYLEVEKMRYGDRINFVINIDKQIDLKIKIPKMVIQLFVENAIKHGLFNKKEGGEIAVNISQLPTTIKITVEDNGIGRKKAGELNPARKGKGMIILRNYLRLFKEQFNREITFMHSDFIKDGEVCGTIVEILVQK